MPLAVIGRRRAGDEDDVLEELAQRHRRVVAQRLHAAHVVLRVERRAAPEQLRGLGEEALGERDLVGVAGEADGVAADARLDAERRARASFRCSLPGPASATRVALSSTSTSAVIRTLVVMRDPVSAIVARSRRPCTRAALDAANSRCERRGRSPVADDSSVTSAVIDLAVECPPRHGARAVRA